MKRKIAEKKLRIWLADDDRDDCELFVEAMHEVAPNVVVTTLKDGEVLMKALFNEQHPDLIFLDLNMPRKNGKECLTEIKADKDLRRIPVIIYSTSLNQKDIDGASEAGAVCFVRKPNSYSLLKEILEQVIAEDFQSHADPWEKILFNLK